MAWLDVLNILGKWNGGTPAPVDVENPIDVADSGERDYTPGRVPLLVTASGSTVVYDNRVSEGGSGTGFRLRRVYAVPVIRTNEEPPVITVEIRDSADVLIKTLEIVAAISERTYYEAPVDSRVVISLDIAARVPCRVTVQEI